jgi:hypothetical protein
MVNIFPYKLAVEMSDAGATISCILIVILSLVAYAFLRVRLAQPDVQGISWAAMLANFLPVFITVFDVAFCCVIMYSSAQSFSGGRRK